MKKLFMRFHGIISRLIHVAWIVSPIGEQCSPVPVYIFMEDE